MPRHISKDNAAKVPAKKSQRQQRSDKPSEMVRLRQSDVRGVAIPVSLESENVTLRLAGNWLDLWNRLKATESELSPSEILRQAIALRAALSAVDSDGKKPQAFITYKDDDGTMVTVDLEQHVGIKP